MVYLFKRHKKSGTKKIIEVEVSEEYAKQYCKANNKSTDKYWYEWTNDVEYTKN